MTILLIWLLFAVILACWARNWGRSFFLYLIFSLLLSPIIAAIILLISGREKPKMKLQEEGKEG